MFYARWEDWHRRDNRCGRSQDRLAPGLLNKEEGRRKLEAKLSCVDHSRSVGSATAGEGQTLHRKGQHARGFNHLIVNTALTCAVTVTLWGVNSAVGGGGASAWARIMPLTTCIGIMGACSAV